jgi:hypothetical protein
VLQYVIDKRKKQKQGEATATDVHYSQTTKKKVGRPSHADKVVQAEAKANHENTIAAAADAFAQLKAQAHAGGKKQVPTGELDRCIEEAKLANNVPASANISKWTVYSRVSRGNHSGQKISK